LLFCGSINIIERKIIEIRNTSEIMKQLYSRCLGKLLSAAILTCSTFTLSSAAEALTFTFHSNQTDWQNALNGADFVTEDFNDATLISEIASIDSDLGGGINQFGASNAFGDRVSSDLTILGGIIQAEIGINETVFTFSQPVIGFAGTFNLDPQLVATGLRTIVTLQDSSTQTAPQEVARISGNQFYGFTVDEPITQVTIREGTDPVLGISLARIIHEEGEAEEEKSPKRCRIRLSRNFTFQLCHDRVQTRSKV
jgi:hypothetical protein